MQYCANIIFTVGFISLIFVLLFLNTLNFLQQKNTEQQYLVIILLCRVRASEPQVDSRDHLIVVIEVGLWLEIDRYSCE